MCVCVTLVFSYIVIFERSSSLAELLVELLLLIRLGVCTHVICA